MDIITSKKMGEAIRRRRNELGYSQEQLAEMAAMSYQQIQRYENGYSMLNVENIQRIAKVLHVPATSFFTLDQPEATSEPSTLYYISSAEKNLLRHFRSLSALSDKHLVISVARRIAKK